MVCVAAVSALAVFCVACAPNTQVRINISEDSITLGLGEVYELAAAATGGYEIVWSSSDESVATVTQQGEVTAVAGGQAEITASAASANAVCTVTVDPILLKGERRLVWNDEFDGDELDGSKWGYQLGVQDTYGSSQGPVYWGNNELQYYTQDAVSVEDGMLTITAAKEEMPSGREYSSGRILTRDKFSFTYGYIEARISMPDEAGMWPAFWMLPQPSGTDNDNNEYGWWAANGEIDIVEAKGRLESVTDHTLHYGNKGSSTYSSGHGYLEDTIADWHVYGLEWTEEYIAWFIDGAEVYRVAGSVWWTESADKSENPAAPFDKDFYILINLAVGGNYDGGTRPSAEFEEAALKVDYVRVYQ